MQQGFARFFADKSSITTVRKAEPLGYDPDLQLLLGEMGYLGIRVPEPRGGTGGALIEAVLMLEEAGRALAPAILTETVISCRLLAELAGATQSEWLQDALSGIKVVTLALYDAAERPKQVVPGGAVADALLFLDQDGVFLAPLDRNAPDSNLGSQPISQIDLSASVVRSRRVALSTGEQARNLFLACVEEWKLLTASALNGLSRRSLEYAVDYAKEREQFGRPIGAYQAVAHPLADRAIDVDAAQLLVWWAADQVAQRHPDAGAFIDLAYWRACKTADETSRRSIHTFGGYGVTLEYDPQLFFRRAKAWPLVLGDPDERLIAAGRRLWLDEPQPPLPDAGDSGLDFEFGEDAEALASETRALLEDIITPEWRAKALPFFEGYDAEINKKIGEAGLVHPSWPTEWGGRAAHPYAAALSLSVWAEFDVPYTAQSTAHFIGSAIIHSGSPELQSEVLRDIGGGLKNCSLGYTEPSSGSDVFAAKTRSEWDEENQEWVINGQKIFTSGAEMTDYIFLLTRTDLSGPKHASITMFLVPTNALGVEVHPVHTMQDERTNATFYSNVRLPDRYRVGEVNGGAKVLSAALILEHGAAYSPAHHSLIELAVESLRNRGRIGDSHVLYRLAAAKINAILSELLSKKTMYFGVTHPGTRTAFGSMTKLFRTECFQSDLNALMDLIAPDSLFCGRDGAGQIEAGHRQAQIRTIYGGTSEVHRSVIAEVGLGLPRSR